MSCSRTWHSDAGEARTRNPLISSQAYIFCEIILSLPRIQVEQLSITDISTDTHYTHIDTDMLKTVKRHTKKHRKRVLLVEVVLK